MNLMKRKSYERNRRIIGQTQNKKRNKYMSISVTKADFLEYKRVQKDGSYNMFDPRAREMTNLSKSQWSTIITDYSKLDKAWGKPPIITGDKDTDSLLEDERINNEIN